MSNQIGKKPFQQKGKGKNFSQSNDKKKKIYSIYNNKWHEFLNLLYNSFNKSL